MILTPGPRRRSVGFLRPGIPQVDWANPITRGLIGCWPLGLTYGYEITSQQPLGTLTANPSITVGPYGNGLLLNGTTQWVDVPANTAFNNITAVTAMCWARATNFTNAYITFISKINAGKTASFQLLGKASGRLAWYAIAVTSVHVDPGGITLSTGPIYHLVLTYDSVNGLKGYVNGVVDASAAANGTLAVNTGDLFFGHDSGTAAHEFAGSYHNHVSIWNRSLSQAEVVSLYLDPTQFLVYSADTIGSVFGFMPVTPSPLLPAGAVLI